MDDPGRNDLVRLDFAKGLAWLPHHTDATVARYYDCTLRNVNSVTSFARRGSCNDPFRLRHNLITLGNALCLLPRLNGMPRGTTS
jgi:hypothetical protein